MKTKTNKSFNGERSPFKMTAWLLAAVGVTALLCAPVQAERATYVFKKVAELGVPAPGGGNHINDFEPGAINNRGDVIYGTDLGTSADPTTFFGEGVFLVRSGQSAESELLRSGGSAPGGGVFDFLLLGQTVLNERGDGAIAFTLSPFGLPVGVNSGVYRYSQMTHAVSPLVVPGVTRAPAGGTFAGVFFGTSLNNNGDLVFPGIVATDKGIHLPDEPYTGLGMGVFKANKSGQITSVLSPGDAAPGGASFDMAGNGGAWINQAGNVAFTAHVAGEEVRIEGFPPQAQILSSLTSLYIKKAGTGKIISVAHAGAPAPGGGFLRDASSPVMNDFGDIVFLGDLTPPPHANQALGVFLHSKGSIIAVARPGDRMPGGGGFVTASTVSSQQIHVNNEGEVAFNAVLSTDVNGDGTSDTGLFVWSRGSVRLVARTGTVIQGVGTIDRLVMGVITFPPPPILVPNSGAINNDLGQVLFGATLSDGRGVLLVATPSDQEGNQNGNNF